MWPFHIHRMYPKKIADIRRELLEHLHKEVFRYLQQEIKALNQREVAREETLALLHAASHTHQCDPDDHRWVHHPDLRGDDICSICGASRRQHEERVSQLKATGDMWAALGELPLELRDKILPILQAYEDELTHG